MKKSLLGLLMACTFLATIFFMQSVTFAEVPAAPVGFQLLASDDFTAADDTTFVDYAGGTGFATKWCSDVACTLTSFTSPSRYIKNGGFYIPQTGTTSNTYRRMNTTVDLTKDAEYFLMGDIYSSSKGSTPAQRIYLRNSDGSKALFFGSIYSADLFANVPTLGGTTLSNWTKNYKIPDGTYTMVAQISTRATGNDYIRVRIFADPAVEAPSFTPLYWDEEYYINNGNTYTNLNTLHFQTQGMTAADSSMFDNFRMYKAEPVTVTASVSSTSRFLTAGETLTVTVNEAANISGNPQTASVTWYNAADMSTPLSSGAAYTVPESMINQILRAKVVLTDTVTSQQTTYYPVSRLVHNYYEISKITLSSNTARTAKINYVDWTANTSLYFTTEFLRGKNADNVGSVQLMVAQYAVDGQLKKVFPFAGGKYNGMSTNGYTRLQVPITLNQGNPDPATKNYASGDYFKAFVWYSTNSTAFAFDTMKPMDRILGNNAWEDKVIVP